MFHLQAMTTRGIHLWHAANATIVSNNLVFENRTGGIVIGAGDEPGGVVDDNTIVSNNIVVYNYVHAGIAEYGETGTHNRYLNNLVYANPAGAFRLLNGNKVSGTLTVDPQFVNWQPNGSGDYHLESTSPAIGAGTSTGAPSVDIVGTARPQGNRWDIGPYEVPA
jgi:pectate disaccharide-lyase